MKKLFSIVAVLGSILYGQGQAHAFDLLNTARPDKVISVGIRAGFNSSNLTNNYKDKYPSVISMNQHWRNGFSLGAVVDLNLAGFFTIQPGVVVSTRKNSYDIVVDRTEMFELYRGSQNCKYFTVPVLASFRMGVQELVQLQLDLGPYFAWGFGGKNKYTQYTYQTDEAAGIMVPKVYHEKSPYFGNSGLAKRYDYGIKTGVGVLAFGKIYLGAHFMYGFRNALQHVPLSDKPVKGHNKRWEFTVGYNL